MLIENWQPCGRGLESRTQGFCQRVPACKDRDGDLGSGAVGGQRQDGMGWEECWTVPEILIQEPRRVLT